MKFTVNVTATGGGTPKGRATVKAGTQKLCTVRLSAGRGSCRPHPKSLKVGSYSVVATYRASRGFASSTSGEASLNVSIAPTTKITSAPSGEVPSGNVEISFTSDEPESTFQCRLDAASYAPCSSPDQLPNVTRGHHSFMVRAINSHGIADPQPPSAHWISVGPLPRINLCGQIAASETLSPEEARAYVLTCNVTVAAAATLTVQPGTVVKGGSSYSLTAAGIVNAVGTEASPITFTSINDNSVGGATGSGSPAAGDWGGIFADGEGSVDVQHGVLDYASSAIRSTTTGTLTIEASTLASNEAAVKLDASSATSVALHGDWFDNNASALAGSSVWVSTVSCQYTPTMSATGNVYGASKVATPFVSEMEFAEINADLLVPETTTWPAGWTSKIAEGATDHLTWSVQSCTEGGPSHSVLATPFEFA